MSDKYVCTEHKCVVDELPCPHCGADEHPDADEVL